ncbi:MAG: deoxyribose-phosphate aldolase [Prevotella sp.]|jgi:deoxyribose-phosphate aldolase|nr:deoxyribose-phosphate aldolase [Prevotella sp.]
MEQIIKNLTVAGLAGIIDHTFLKPYGTAADIEKLCAEADKYKFAMVAINPAEVITCAQLLKNSSVRVGAAIGFPLGQTTVECKAFETRDAIEKGATEIDTVINIRALQKGQLDIVRKEIQDMVSICKPAGVICKVILETCYLTDEEKEIVCRIAKEENVDFVKTSTGFGTAGATLHDVALMRRVVGPDIGVKAAGGIRDLETALAMIEAGATRLGTSSGVSIVESFTQLKKEKNA